LMWKKSEAVDFEVTYSETGNIAYILLHI